MDNQQEQSILLNSIFSKIDEIKVAYENLGLGDFDNAVYQQIVAIDINSIEALYNNFNELGYAKRAFGMVDFEISCLRYEKQVIFDALVSIMPEFRQYVNGYNLRWQ